MGAQHGKLLLLLAAGAIAGGGAAPSAAAADGVCDAGDPRKERSNGDNDDADGDRGFDENDFGEPQLIPAHLANSVNQVISNSIQYMENVMADAKYDSVHDECRNHEEKCSQWALGSGCDDNPKYMKVACCPACRSCDYLLDMKRKCAFDPDGKDAIKAGGMDALFERIVRVAGESGWQPRVLSRPRKDVATSSDGGPAPMSSCDDDVTNPCDAQIGPWVITLENFVTPEEVSSLLKWGSDMGYERSRAGGRTTDRRNSSHAWCTRACYRDPAATSMRRRIAAATGIPEENYESFQLLKYAPGTYYMPHDDFVEGHAEKSHGTRLLTFLMYFNSVEMGGDTRFPRLNDLRVRPRRGRALVWPSVLDEDLYEKDARTEHEAMPVIRGEKYAANAWIHTRDFQTPSEDGCPTF